jgi:GT2 family glycosyltransferase
VEVRYFRPCRNLGYAGACYVGAKLLKNTSILTFSNNDIIFTEDSLAQLLRTMQLLPKVGAVQPLVLINGSFKVDSIGSTCNGIMHGFNYSNWPVKPLRRLSLKNGLMAIECFGIDGMMVMLRADVWEKVRGWDPSFFMFNEDGLLSWKLRLAGYKNYVALSSVVYHERGGTAKGYFTKKDPIFPSYYTSRNKILSILYIHEGVWLIIYLFASIFFEFVKNLTLSLKNRSSINLYYYLKALIFIMNARRHIISERAKVPRKLSTKHFLKKSYVLPLSTSLAWLLKRRKTILE